MSPLGMISDELVKTYEQEQKNQMRGEEESQRSQQCGALPIVC